MKCMMKRKEIKNVFILQKWGISEAAKNVHLKHITGQKKTCTRIKFVFLLRYVFLFSPCMS